MFWASETPGREAELPQPEDKPAAAANLGSIVTAENHNVTCGLRAANIVEAVKKAISRK